MDYFDKKINELYNQHKQEVPNDLSWDFMEDGIYSRMENKKSKRKAFWYWFVGGIATIAIVVIAAIIFNTEESKSNFATNDPVNTKNNSSDSEARIPTSQVKINTSNNNNLNSTPAVTIENANTESQIIALNEKTITKEDQSISNQPSTTSSNEVNDQVVIVNSNSSIKEKSVSAAPSTNFISNTINNASAPIVQSRDDIYLNNINSNALSTLKSKRELIQLSLKKITVEKNPRKGDEKCNNKYALSLLGGTSFNSGYNIINSDYHSSLPGYSIKLGLSSEKENGWGYELGIGHALLVEKFDFEKTDTIQEHHENILVGHLTNTLTGNTSDLIGSGYRNNSRKRKEVIYNTINLLSIDAAIYKRIQLSNKWSIVPSAGIQYDRVLSIKGKTLDLEGEVFPYDNNSAEINKNIISTKLGVNIEYAITNKFSLGMRANKSISLNNLYNGGNKLSTTYLQGGISINL